MIPSELGGDLYLINGNMIKLQDAGIFAGANTNQKENETNEEVLELEETEQNIEHNSNRTGPRKSVVS